MATPEQKQVVKTLLEQHGITRDILFSCFDDDLSQSPRTPAKRKRFDEEPSTTRNLTLEDQQLVDELCRLILRRRPLVDILVHFLILTKSLGAACAGRYVGGNAKRTRIQHGGYSFYSFGFMGKRRTGERTEFPAILTVCGLFYSHDPIIAAKIIRSYIHKHGILQRDIVSATSLSQSHLSQHLNNGTSMNLAKRRKLYEWYVEDQRTYGRGLDMSGSNATDSFTVAPVTPTPDVLPGTGSVSSTPSSGDRGRTRSHARRTKVKWGNDALKLLNEAYQQNPRPSKDARVDLVRKCAALEAENMENKLAVPGSELPDGAAVVTEERVLTWFANKRKDELQRSRMQQAEAAVRLASAQTQVHQVLGETVHVDSIQGGGEAQHVLLVQASPGGTAQGGHQFVVVQNPTSVPVTMTTTRASDATPGATYVVDSTTQVVSPAQQDMTVAAETVEVATSEVGQTEEGGSAAASAAVVVETEVAMDTTQIVRESEVNGVRQTSEEGSGSEIIAVVTQVLASSGQEGQQ